MCNDRGVGPVNGLYPLCDVIMTHPRRRVGVAQFFVAQAKGVKAWVPYVLDAGHFAQGVVLGRPFCFVVNH